MKLAAPRPGTRTLHIGDNLRWWRERGTGARTGGRGNGNVDFAVKGLFFEERGDGGGLGGDGGEGAARFFEGTA